MKIEFADKLVIYINNNYLKNKHITLDDIEDCLKKICEILNENYQIKLNGLYNIDVYIDNKYGLILEIEKEDFDFDYYIDQVDMQISIHYTKFLLEIKTLDAFYNHKIYLYKHKYYTDFIEQIEMGELVYKTDNILKRAKVIEI